MPTAVDKKTGAIVEVGAYGPSTPLTEAEFHERNRQQRAREGAAREQAEAELEKRHGPWRREHIRLHGELDTARAVLAQFSVEIDLSSRRSAAKSADRLTRRVGAELLVQISEANLNAHKAQEPS